MPRSKQTSNDKHASRKRRSSRKVPAAVLDPNAQKKADEQAKREAENVDIGTINWQWRKFALGIMNGLNNYQAYAQAYDYRNVETDEREYQLCAVYSSRLLKNDKFRAYWRDLLEEQGFNNDMVDSQMLMLITDPLSPHTVRRAAIRDYNELQGRIIKKASLTDDEGNSLFDAAKFTIEVVQSGTGNDSKTKPAGDQTKPKAKGNA